MSIKCHSSFAHYHMFHDNHCHGGGNNYGSIFNITNNCGGGCGGGFWGGLGMGLGYGFGNMFGGLFGGFMGGFGNMFGGFGNMLGGFGMPGMLGGFGMGGWGLSSLFGGGGGGSTCSCGCDGKKVSLKDEKDYGKREEPQVDIDNPKFAELTKEIKALTPGSVSEEDYNDIKQKIEQAKKETDSINKVSDETTYDNLLAMLDDYKNNTVVNNGAQSLPEGNNGASQQAGGEDAPAGGDNQSAGDAPGSNFWNGVTFQSMPDLELQGYSLPDGYTPITEPIEISAGNIKLAHDTGEPGDVSGPATISERKYKNGAQDTIFPEYIQIQDSTNSQDYKYKCVGMSGGYPIYVTPNTDKNSNAYILVQKKNSSDIILLQTKEFPGHNIEDLQNKQ